MIKNFMLASIFFATLCANNNYDNEKSKNCETISLSELTSIVSSNKVDYLIEYKLNDDYKRVGKRNEN